MSIIQINANKCVLCGRCVKVCPAILFKQHLTCEKIEVENQEQCIKCGHCVAVCPEGAILHSDFSADNMVDVDYDQMVDDDKLMELLLVRRSMRVFTKQPIPDRLLDKIVRAANLAPTASNKRELSYALVTNKQKLEAISQLTVDAFSDVLRKIDRPIVRQIVAKIKPDAISYIPAFKRLKSIKEQGKDPILRNATAVLFIHAPNNTRFGCQDANLAYQNASLMAQTLNVGHFYTGFVCSAAKMKQGKELAKLLGIDGEIHAGMALGMPQFNYPRAIVREDLKLRRF